MEDFSQYNLSGDWLDWRLIEPTFRAENQRMISVPVPVEKPQGRAVSAYAIFFRDAQIRVKENNPNASFGERSKAIAAMWENMDEGEKKAYKRRSDLQKRNQILKAANQKAQHMVGQISSCSKPIMKCLRQPLVDKKQCNV